MTKRYVVWVTEEVTKKVWFDADGIAEASDLIEQIELGELNIEDLPNVDEKIKGGETTFETPEEAL